MQRLIAEQHLIGTELQRQRCFRAAADVDQGDGHPTEQLVAGIEELVVAAATGRRLQPVVARPAADRHVDHQPILGRGAIAPEAGAGGQRLGQRGQRAGLRPGAGVGVER